MLLFKGYIARECVGSCLKRLKNNSPFANTSNISLLFPQEITKPIRIHLCGVAFKSQPIKSQTSSTSQLSFPPTPELFQVFRGSICTLYSVAVMPVLQPLTVLLAEWHWICFGIGAILLCYKLIHLSICYHFSTMAKKKNDLILKTCYFWNTTLTTVTVYMTLSCLCISIKFENPWQTWKNPTLNNLICISINV